MAPLADPVVRLETTVFDVMSRLARELDAINLGQGFPDAGAPRDVLEAAAHALLHGDNQYPPMRGLPELRRAAAAHAQRFYGLVFDADSEVLVTAGATEALAAAFLSLLGPGDECIVIEPAYDSYAPMIRRAGATPRVVALQPPDWQLDPEALARAVRPTTRAVVVNDPLNPVAKAFERHELERIAVLCREHDLVAVCDEAYEHIVFDGRPHVPLAVLPGMRDRCVRISSAGKTFSLTGWKVGLLSGPAPLVARVAAVHQYLTFTVPPNLQLGVAVGLALEDDYFDELALRLQEKRDRLARGLTTLGFDVGQAGGTYFLCASYADISHERDEEFALRLVRDAGVTTIPLSAFTSAPTDQDVIRFCFSKSDDVLDAALARLADYLSV